MPVSTASPRRSRSQNKAFLQDVFDRVVAQLSLQKRHVGNTVRYPYRYSRNTDSGTPHPVSVGCLIPDECYTPIIEGYPIASNRVKPFICRSLGVARMSSDLQWLLIDLQCVSETDKRRGPTDRRGSTRRINDELCEIASRFGLEHKKKLKRWYE